MVSRGGEMRNVVFTLVGGAFPSSSSREAQLGSQLQHAADTCKVVSSVERLYATGLQASARSSQ